MAAPVRPPAWKFPHATGAAQKKQKKKKRESMFNFEALHSFNIYDYESTIFQTLSLALGYKIEDMILAFKKLTI